jgi:2'-5' RNA ligase
MQMLRLFFAHKITEELKESISTFQQEMTVLLPPKTVKLLAPSNLHITLHFLGDTDQEKLAVLKTIMYKTAADFGSFSLSVCGFGAFPGIKRPSVLYLGLKAGSSSVAAVHEKMGTLLREAGFPTDTRSFTPHLTVGRVKKCPDDRTAAVFRRLRNKYSSHVFGECTVKEIVLYKSNLTPSGAVYEEIEKNLFV